LVGDDGRARLSSLTERALGLLHATDYQGLATVEFVADETGSIYFLEVNTRLQVEHPVTETRCGVDLVQAQLEIAAGRGFPSLEGASPRGHSVEARVYAEDPQKNFMPQPGTIVRCVFPEGEGIRVDSGVVEGYEITPHYDPLLAKVIAHADDRPRAITLLHSALERTRLVVESKRGRRATNLEFLKRVLKSDEFSSGDYDTSLASRLVSPG
jgi:3-methylcrotonyl-CoA carboxylase alpha subunit